MAGILQQFTAQKGSKCVAVVQSALDDIGNGLSQPASTKLCRLREDSDQLAASAQQLAKRLDKIEHYYISQGEEIQKEIGALGCREEDLRREIRNETIDLESNRSVLRDNESSLRSAESDVEDAERKLQKARDDEGDGVKAGAIAGAILGLPFFGIGALFGAALGAGVGAIVEACIDEVSEARERLGRRRSDEQSARSAVNESERRVSSIQSQIHILQGRIGELKTKQQNYHEKVGETKNTILLLKKSIEFWKLFQQASQHGSSRTTLLQNIIDKANEIGNYTVLGSRGTKRVAKTFLEAWESLESMAAEGSSSHLLQIEFTCTYCGGHHTALPYLDKESRFVCSRCSHQYAIEN